MEQVLKQIATTAEMEMILHFGVALTPAQIEDLRLAVYRVLNEARVHASVISVDEKLITRSTDRRE